MTVQEIAKQVLSLDTRERAEIAEVALRSLDSTTDVENAHLWMREAERRKAEVANGTAQPILIDDIFARLDRKFA